MPRNRGRRNRRRSSAEDTGPLREFFEQHSWFSYDPHQSASAQFHRLQTEADWKRDDPEQTEAWEDYLKALVGQFNTSYGTEEDDLTAWHGLFARIGINDLPDTVQECKQVKHFFLVSSVSKA
jgi:hypothetical protein